MTKPSPGITNDAAIIARMRETVATPAPDISPAPNSANANTSDASKVESTIAKGVLAKLIDLLRSAK